MNMMFEDYDLTLAVIARRTLIIEARTDEERMELVWEPTREWLESLARSSPTELTCFVGEPYQFCEKPVGPCVNLYAVNSDKQVVYLGTVFTLQAARDDRSSEVKRLEILNTYQAELLATSSCLTIIRDCLFCKIPVAHDYINEGVLVDAVQRFLQVFAPNLVELDVCWLSEEKGVELDKVIWGQAKETAHISSRDTRLRIRAKDHLWG